MTMLKKRLTSQLINGISRFLQKLLKYFNGTIILTSFVLPPAGVLPVIFTLVLNVPRGQLPEQLPPEKNCSPVGVGIWVKVRVSFRAGGNQTIVPEVNCATLRVRV